jgi:hypothetical protein
MKFLTARYGFILLGVLLAKDTFAQVPDTSTAQKLIQWIFQPIDKNQVSTGYLEEYGCPIIPMSTFNGTLSDSNRIDMDLWRTLYLQFQTGWIKSTANPSPAITAVNAVIKQNTSNELPVPVPIFLGSYNTVKSDAFSAGLLQYSSTTNQIFDVAGRTQDPYDAKTLFAACPNRKQTVKGTETFVVKPEMIWNNSGKTISQVQIDFATGAGFQNINVGTPFTINYADTGYKRWTIKATLSDNSVLQCYADYYVLRVSANPAARFSGTQATLPWWGVVNAVNGVHSGAIVTVNYSVNNFSGTLRKPLIVVEGYDVSFVAPGLQPNYGVEDFIRGINEPQGYDFNNQLDNIAGYDLVFIDFNNGADDIVRNAAVVQEVINRVNANKVLDNRFGNIRQQNVVMGLSMGGLCARYALANMTKNFPANPTETKLLITHDSPHKGANVPLGLQYLIWMMRNVNLFGNNVYDIYPAYDDAISLLSAPATQQLLLYRATSETQFANNTFLDGVYRNMITFASTDPQPTYKFAATSLGSECAHPLYAPYTKLLNIDGDGYFFLFPLLSYRLRTVVEAFALPSSGTGKIARLKLSSKFKLFGLITISKDYYNNTAYASGTQLPIDGVPGATNPIADFVVPTYDLFFPIPGLLGIWGYTSVHTSGTPTNFAFVPAASALDAAPYTTPVFSEKYVNGVNFNYPSTARTFIAQETAPNATNNVHIRFTARNSHWMYNEMEGLPNTENCSSECSPSGSFTISGSPSFCTSGAYSVNAPSGANVTWSVSPAGIASLQSNGTTATLSRISTGNVTLVATVSLCGLSQTISIPVYVGKLSEYTLSFDGFSDITAFFWERNKNYNFTVNGPGASNFAWNISTQYGTFWTPSSTNSNPFSAKAPSSFSVPPNDVVVSFDETCGSRITLRKTLIYNYYNDPAFYYVSPNPATSTLTVACVMSNEQHWGPSIRRITISSLNATLLDMPFSSPIGSYTVQVSNWPAGQYYVSIYNGVNWFSKSVLINH